MTNNNALTGDWNVAAFIVNSKDKRVKLPENNLWKSTKIVDKNKESLELKVWISKEKISKKENKIGPLNSLKALDLQDVNPAEGYRIYLCL